MNFDSGQALGGADWYLLTPTLIWKVSKPSLRAGTSQNNRSRKIKELDKKAKSSTKKKKNKGSEENEKLSYVHVRARKQRIAIA
ncbi:hypothetical protein Bca4012_027121 [Brassica carinata]